MRFFAWVIVLALPACHIISVNEYEYIQERNKQSMELIKKNSMLEQQVAQLEQENRTIKEKTNDKSVESEPCTPAIEASAAEVANPESVAKQTTSGFYLQLGAYRSEKSAVQFLNQLDKSWGTAHVETLDSGLHAVRIGPFLSRKEATAQRQLIHTRAGLEGFILEKK